MRVRYNSPLLKVFPKNIKAFVFGSTIFVREEKMSERLFKHEFTHVLQYQRLGIIRFLALYYFEMLKNFIKYKDFNKAYKEISFEKEAREAENG